MNISSLHQNGTTEVFETSWNLTYETTEKAYIAAHHYYNHLDQIDYVTFNKFVNVWVSLTFE